MEEKPKEVEEKKEQEQTEQEAEKLRNLVAEFQNYIITRFS